MMDQEKGQLIYELYKSISLGELGQKLKANKFSE